MPFCRRNVQSKKKKKKNDVDKEVVIKHQQQKESNGLTIPDRINRFYNLRSFFFFCIMGTK